MTGESSNKEVGSTPNFHCPILKPANYPVWAIRMKTILEANGLWDIVESEKAVDDKKKERTAMAFIYQGLPEDQLMLVSKHKTPKEVWDALRTRNVGNGKVQQAKLQTLKAEFELMQMKDDDTIEGYAAKLTTLSNKTASLGHAFSEDALVRKFLNSAHDRYITIVASLEQYCDLTKMTLDDAAGRLKVFEDRIKVKKGKKVDNQKRLMFLDTKIEVDHLEDEVVANLDIKKGTTISSRTRKGMKIRHKETLIKENSTKAKFNASTARSLDTTLQDVNKRKFPSNQT